MNWICACKEPTLDELLDDPMTVAVMRRDGVDRHRFEELVRQVASRLSQACTAMAEAPCSPS